MGIVSLIRETGGSMLEISMFYGIVIYMYYQDHMPPHFHARYQGAEACFTFDGELMDGDFPAKQRKLVAAWSVLNADDSRQTRSSPAISRSSSASDRSRRIIHEIQRQQGMGSG